MRGMHWAIALVGAWYVLCRCDIIWLQGFKVKDREDAMNAADFLKALTTRIEKLISSPAHALDPRIQRIRDRWNGTLSELDGKRAGNIAHSVGKRDISICIRDPDGTLADENAAMFVVIHELAHVASRSIGHTDEFWDAMRFLLELGEYTGAYNYTDHDREHTMLCGKKLGSNPMTCVKENTCKSSLIA